MLWVQALVFCGGLIYAAVDDLKTRTVCDIVCIIIAAAGLITISPACMYSKILFGIAKRACVVLLDSRNIPISACAIPLMGRRISPGA